MGARRTATFASLTETVGLVVIASATSLPEALAGAVIVGLGFAMLFPSLALMVVGNVSDEHRGSAMGAFTAFFDVGVGLGAPLAGLTASIAGYPPVFYLSAGAALLAAALSSMPLAARER